MAKEERDIQRKLKELHHAEKTDHVARTCRYFGVGRWSFYRWKAAYDLCGEARQAMFDYGEMFYNLVRKQVRNRMLSPVEFERQQILNAEGV